MPIPIKTSAGLNPPADPFCVFLDVDGVLLEIAQTPDSVTLHPELPAILKQLCERCEGALALVSGRSLAFLEQMFDTLGAPMAGLHGAERRMPDGSVETIEFDNAQLKSLRVRLEEFAVQHPGIQLEDKGIAIAVHFRAEPTLGPMARTYLEDMLPSVAPGFHVQPGKMVYEVKPCGMDKGAAIELLLSTQPFRGRTPIFAGDDVTDEHGFAVVNARDGISVKVGDGLETIARYHIESVSEMRAWLICLASAPAE